MAAPVCDIVLLSWNAPKKLSACLEGLFGYTDVSSRLIVVDNASEPNVREQLKELVPRGLIEEVCLLQNERNEGFSRGMNRGIRESSAPYVCLINNDTVCSPHWLSRMIEVAEAHPEIGVLNPESNTFGNNPNKGETLIDYARRLEAKRGEYVEVGSCIGFCLLIKRQVIDRVGLLDEELGPFFYEDDDYCIRSQNAGFRCVVVRSAYVLHQEHHSVKQLPEREEIFRASYRRFVEKWGRELRIAYFVSREHKSASDELRETLEKAMAWARRRAFVRLYMHTSDIEGQDAAFKSVGLIPHCDVMIFAGGRLRTWVKCLTAILTRRKKPFDLVVTDKAAFARLAVRLGWLHGAHVVMESDKEQFEELWTKLSRCQL